MIPEPHFGIREEAMMFERVALIDSAEASVSDMLVHDLFVQESLKNIA